MFNYASTHVAKAIRDAASRISTLTITYQDNAGTITQREVEPYEIKDDSLYAYCYTRDGIRRFKLNRILDCKVTGRKFNPRWEIKIN